MAKKFLKLSLEVIKSRFLKREDVKVIAEDAGCSKTTIYRLMEANSIKRKRRYTTKRKVSGMVYNIKILPEYKNGRLL